MSYPARAEELGKYDISQPFFTNHAAITKIPDWENLIKNPKWKVWIYLQSMIYFTKMLYDGDARINWLVNYYYQLIINIKFH